MLLLDMKKLTFTIGFVFVSSMVCFYLRYASVFKPSVSHEGVSKVYIPNMNDIKQQSTDIKRIFLANNMDMNVLVDKHKLVNNVPAVTNTTYWFPHQNISLDHRKFAVLAVSTPVNNNYNYVFIIPLTVLAWKRVGYDTLMLIAGSEVEWKNHTVLSAIYRYLMKLDCTVHFLNCEPKHRTMISQVSRLFAASVLRDLLRDDDYLITSDSDLWPINSSIYELKSPPYKIVNTNSDCCGYFDFNGTTYKMLPMCSTGASTATWLELLADDIPPQTAADILLYFNKRFGNDSTKQEVQKGENAGWYSDQRMMSILVQEWINRNNRSSVQYIPRDVRRDRIDRARWTSPSLVNKTDAHLLENAYNYKTWFQLTPLLRQMYGEDSSAFNFCMQYFESFLEAFKMHQVHARV